MPATKAVDPAEATARLSARVREAGALALSMFGTGSTPVCEADIAVDRLLRERLAGDDAGFGWLSEESADDPARLTARYIWIVDPIDGIRAYLAGMADWAAFPPRWWKTAGPLPACLYAPATE